MGESYQEIAARCLEEFQAKYPQKGYYACTPVKDKPNHFVLLSEGKMLHVRWEPDYQAFATVEEKTSVLSDKEQKVVHMVDDSEWYEIKYSKAGALPTCINVCAILMLVLSAISLLAVILSPVIGFAAFFTGLLSSALLFAVSAIVKSVRKIEEYVSLSAKNSCRISK